MSGLTIISPNGRRQGRVLRNLAKAFREASVRVLHDPKVLETEEGLGEVVLEALKANGFNPRERS